MDTLLGMKALPPGIRFYPTDEELFMFYLKRKVLGKSLGPCMMSEVDVYQFAPWELPAKACLKTRDLNWFFLCPRSKKYPNGGRSNRATVHGYWKSTGIDRTVNYQNRPVGKIKTLIFHCGKAPKGDRTDWVMHEYRLDDKVLLEQSVAQDSYVICKIYEKSGLGPKNGEHYGAPFVEEDWESENDDNLEADRGFVLHPEGGCSSHDPITGTGTVAAPAETGQLVPTVGGHSEQGSVLSGNKAAQDAPTPSTEQQPEAAVGLALPPIETEEDELDRLLAVFTDGDPNQVPVPDADIFMGLDVFAGEDTQSAGDLDWAQYLSDDCFMELKDLLD